MVTSKKKVILFKENRVFIRKNVLKWETLMPEYTTWMHAHTYIEQ